MDTSAVVSGWVSLTIRTIDPAEASKDGRQAVMVEAQRYLRCLDTETVRSLRRCEERECQKREKRMLQDENYILKETVQNLTVPPSTKEGLKQDPVPSLVVILVEEEEEEEEEDAAGTEVPEVEADKSSLATEGEESASAGSMVSVIEETQPDTAA
ncbi:hypothetical protein LWI28_018363 [Acer negundo]|uniref:Uncharacterized protein n=1 Tax=Acer negundo TaxID=4023 RepID=A0AAD5NGR4_ACENE|nr:hypothetical protein LWI28_018363 [Acer negundo]